MDPNNPSKNKLAKPIKQDPPVKRSVYSSWISMFAKLELQPVAWYLIGEWDNRTAAGATAHRLRQRYGHFQFRTTSEEGAGSKLYAKKKEGDK